MKNVKRLSLILAFALPCHIMAQTLDKKAISKSPYQIRHSILKGSGVLPMLYPDKMQKDHLAFKANYRNAQLNEPMRFPHQDPAGSYFSSCPISLGNGQVLMVWISQMGDTVYCVPSSDAGVSWESPVVVAATTPFAFQLSGVRTTTGRIIAVWGSGAGRVASFSDDNGKSWTAPRIVTPFDGGFTLNVTQTVDGKLWLLYNRNDIYFRTSTNNGASWSSERALFATPAQALGGTVVSGSGSTLYLFYSENSSGNPDIYRRTSTDGGNTWSAPVPIVNSPQDEVFPKVLRQSADTLWMTYERWVLSTVPGYGHLDIYYTKSTDGGNSWSAPAQFTRYANYDAEHNTTLVNNQPFVSFWSDRWSPQSFQTQIWYGLIGTTMDNNPPPALLEAFAMATEQGFAVVKGMVDDEAGIADVKLSYTLNGTSNGPFQMFDDGQHHEKNASDNIWGAVIGPVQLGDEVIPTFSITDNSSNTVNISWFPTRVRGVHNAGNVILSFNDDGRLAEFFSATGTSAYWPRENGREYLAMGSLYVGAIGGGQRRVSSSDYYEGDWSRTPGTTYTLAPGVSDQDGSVTYDDLSTFSPIGVRVHQQSYQWSAPTRDDFIVFQYTIKNLGRNGNLSNVFVSPWLDPAVTVPPFEENYDDLAGYDSQRHMIYVYDSQNDPGGYIGLKLLGTGNVPHTVLAYGPQDAGGDDALRYQFMSNGGITIPTDPADYGVLLTAPPFSLAVGDSATVAYGLVLGANLSELQTHADTLEAIYGSIRTGVAEARSDQIPTSYFLAQNYPNPFNPSTTIRYALAQAGQVSLKIFNLAGEEIASLINGKQNAGEHKIQWQAQGVPSGVYFYQLRAGDHVETRKMILMR